MTINHNRFLEYTKDEDGNLIVDEAETAVIIPSDIVEKKIKHKTFGIETITGINGTSIEVSFHNAGVKKMGYEIFMEKKMLEFI